MLYAFWKLNQKLFIVSNSNSNQAEDTVDALRPNLSIASVTLATSVHDDTNIINMKSVSMEEYRKLCQATIDLIKANQTINKLNILIQKKNAIIDDLKIQLETRTESTHLSPVSALISTHIA